MVSGDVGILGGLGLGLFKRGPRVQQFRRHLCSRQGFELLAG